MPRTFQRAAALSVAAIVSLAACGSSADTPAASDGSRATLAATETSPADTSSGGTDTTGTTVVDDVPTDQQYPDVVGAVARRDGETWAFEVTISSPYDTPDRYADGWRVIAPDGTELGFRLLTHDHASEQPFTRSLDGVEIPDGVDTVTIQGRDQANGFGGTTFELSLPS